MLPTSPRVKALYIVASLLLAGCSGQAPPAPPPPEVTVATIRLQSVPNVIELPGRLQAFRTAEVRARVDGIVQARLFEEGSNVRAGKSLFQIDPRQLRTQANSAQAQLLRAQATVNNASQVLRRYDALLGEQAISRQEYDAATANQRTAQADVAQARAQLDSARLSLGYASVTAPISGRVGRAQVTEGALVSAASGTLLTTIEQIDRVYVNFSQSSSDLLAIRRDITSGKLDIPPLGRVEVRLILEDGSVHPQVGYLDFLDLSIDEATGTAALRAEFANINQALLPGQFVRAQLMAGSRQNGIQIPQRAVKLTPTGATVMVVGKDNKPVSRKIKVGTLQAGQWLVLEGLKQGERIIVDGGQKVMPGQPVRIAKPASKAAPKPVPAAR